MRYLDEVTTLERRPVNCTGCELAKDCTNLANRTAKDLMDKIESPNKLRIDLREEDALNLGVKEEYEDYMALREKLYFIIENCGGASEEYRDGELTIICGMEGQG